MDQRITDAIEVLGYARDMAENAGLSSPWPAEEFSRAIDQLRSVDSGIGPVYLLKGQTLVGFLETMAEASAFGIYELRVAVDGGLKIKVNEGSWTPPTGELQS